MSFNEIELKQHCETILQSPRINNKIVILCEGKIEKIEGRLSPQSYKRMEQMPDSNFYKACVPIDWKQYRPQFFNCGDRKDVLDTYFKLLDLHNADSNNSFLNPSKLFAIVDLDIQVAKIKDNYENYKFDDTEEIFYNLYEQGKINETNTALHRIWVTGLVHKEAYFLTPEIQDIFDNYCADTPTYKGNSVNLENIYLDMADEILSDVDLQNNWKIAFSRISHCPDLDGSEIGTFQNSWSRQYRKCLNEIQKKDLIIALLILVKSKEYWRKILPSGEVDRCEYAFRDMLSLEMGKFYSKQECKVENHIPFFFKTLSKYV